MPRILCAIAFLYGNLAVGAEVIPILGGVDANICSDLFVKISHNGKAEDRAQIAQKVPDKPGELERAARIQPDQVIWVRQRNGSIVKGQPVGSTGFATCHLIMIKNQATGEIALMHYNFQWYREQLDILKMFPTNSPVVLLSNRSSIAVEPNIMELANMGYENLKLLHIQENGRWEVVYDPNSDNLTYLNTDAKHVSSFPNVFGGPNP